MFFSKRRFSVAPITSVEELADKLVNYTWCTCNGFDLGGMLFLNDSSSPDGAAEFGVVWHGRQIESITFGWCKLAQAEKLIRECVDGCYDGSHLNMHRVTNTIQSPKEHGRCGACA